MIFFIFLAIFLFRETPSLWALPNARHIIDLYEFNTQVAGLSMPWRISLCRFTFALKFVQVWFGFALNTTRFLRDEREIITIFSRASALVQVFDDCATVCDVYCETFAR